MVGSPEEGGPGSNLDSQTPKTESRFDLAAFGVEQSQKKNGMIKEFAVRHNLALDRFSLNGRSLLIVGDQELPDLKPADLKRYIDESFQVDTKVVTTQCYDVAKAAQQRGSAKSRLHSKGGTSEFSGYGNHCLNLDTLQDGSLVAVDFTAAENIDYHQGNFAVFAIRASSQEELIARLNKLYGGQWSEITPNYEYEVRQNAIEGIKIELEELGEKINSLRLSSNFQSQNPNALSEYQDLSSYRDTLRRMVSDWESQLPKAA
ncbi:hypothetical protein HYS93_01260 [Candidatus Daviesbacteria bacterium]|nr:hypothetical protein [Candidatus Daviesbacteria bacterium]